jgi:hypothetical protein
MRRLLFGMLIAVGLLVLAIPASLAALPAPGSTYHLLFATSNTYRPSSVPSIPPPSLQFGSIAAADWLATNAAHSGALPGAATWNQVTPIYRSVLSIAGDHARYRLSVLGPVLNVHGTQLATGHVDLFDSNLSAPVAYDELGTLISASPDVWTGCTSVGTAAGQTCGTWNNPSSGVTGRIGSAIDSDEWINTGTNKPCNQLSRLFGLSPALTAALWGDYDGSGTVDGRDFLAWQRNVGKSGAQLSASFVAARSFIDGNRADPVGAVDLEVWTQFYGQSLPPAITSVPEPGLAGLLVSLVVIGFFRPGLPIH